MITRDLWLNAIREVEDSALANDPHAITLQEFAKSIGRHRGTAQHLIHKLIKAGRAERTKKLFRRADGVVITVPAYRLKESPNGSNGCGRPGDARRSRNNRSRP